jgi:hypothetical protein
LSDGIVATAPGAKAKAAFFKAGFPAWFQGVFDNGLRDSIFDGQNSKRTAFAISLWDIDPSARFGQPSLMFGHLQYKSNTSLRS